ncbi:MAG: hypothetical protein O2854_02305 [Chloroflexi bacterium]|nr:hypothetical protein [Chloroflexota bacterium]
MKDLPKIYPISLLVIIIFIVFVAAYAVSEQAISGVEASGSSIESSPTQAEDTGFAFHQRAAIWVCPLH